jgi:2-amino-4-hydroxy-6-hydroxymethyldihydropteridine diphosphokinase
MVYISLGSNVGDREMYLQLAVGLIAYRIGKIKKLAPVVETPSWGFESIPFLNTCLAIETSYDPREILKQLLEIETYLGRNRALKNGYQARTIDLDILFYDTLEINTTALTLPHPRLELRQFVLTPLAEIAPQFIHPVLNKSIKTLKVNCADTSEVTLYPTSLSVPQKKTFIAIEGNIGVGKTSFAHALNKALRGKLLLENFIDNPYLEKFYEDPKQYALLVEKAFLEERVKQYHTYFNSSDTSLIISDYHLHKSLLFAEKNLTTSDFKEYQLLYSSQTSECRKPDLLVYLTQSLPQLKQNILQRGRGYEQSIDLPYLNKIEEAYEDWKQSSELNVTKLNLKGVDFLKQPKDFLPLLAALFSA